MIPASKKVSFTDVPESLTNQLAQTLTKPEEPEVIETPEVKEVVEIKEKPKPAPAPEKAVKKQDREGQINICVPPEVKKISFSFTLSVAAISSRAVRRIRSASTPFKCMLDGLP